MIRRRWWWWWWWFLWRRRRLLGWHANGDVWTHLCKLRFGDAADREQILNAVKAPGLRAELDDGFGGGGTDAGEFFELLR